MTVKEKERMKWFLDAEVENYIKYSNSDDFFERPCNRKATMMAQNVAFALATILNNLRVISWEECCQYWAKVGLMERENEECCFAKCDANRICKYTIKEG